MPSKGQSKQGQLPDRIRQYLREHPGEEFRARDVAAALGVPEGSTKHQWSQKVGNALARMTNGEGRGFGGVTRRWVTPEGYSMRIGLYSATPAPVEAPTPAGV